MRTPAAADAFQVLRREKIQHRVVGAEFQHKPAPGALDLVIFGAAGAADDRRDLGNSGGGALRGGGGDGFAIARDKFFGERDHLDHALIGFARARAESDDAVLAENETVARLVALEHFDGFFGKPEARHQIRHEAQAAAEHLGAFFLAVGLVDQAEHRGGVGVVDEFVRQEGVQHHFDRRIGGPRIDQIGALDGDKLFVADRARSARNWRIGASRTATMSSGCDLRHIRAGGFYPQHLGLVAEAVAHRELYRRVAAAMQDEFRIAAEQPGGVDAQRQIARDAVPGRKCREGLGVTLDPAAIHGKPLPCAEVSAFRVQPPAKRRDHQPVLRG